MTRRRDVRGVVLAAGRGERMRPLSAVLPKPLLPVAGRPVAARGLDALVEAGCDAVAINLHHLGAMVRRTFGDAHRGCPITYSEEPILLGTLGVLHPLRDFLAAHEVFCIVNGDSLCDWPLDDLLTAHRRARPAATLLVHRSAAPEAFGGGVAVDDGRIVGFGRHAAAWRTARRKRVFAGAAVLDRRLLERVPEGPGDVIGGLYEPLLDDGETIAALETSRSWHDVGTPRRYLAAALAVALAQLPARASWIHPASEVARDARVRSSMIERSATVESGARLERVIVMDGARIGEGAVLCDAIVAPRISIEARFRGEGALFTAGPDEALVATPLDGG